VIEVALPLIFEGKEEDKRKTFCSLTNEKKGADEHGGGGGKRMAGPLFQTRREEQNSFERGKKTLGGRNLERPHPKRFRGKRDKGKKNRPGISKKKKRGG